MTRLRNELGIEQPRFPEWFWSRSLMVNHGDKWIETVVNREIARRFILKIGYYNSKINKCSLI